MDGGVAPGARDAAYFDGTAAFTATINAKEAAQSVTVNDTSAIVADNAQLSIGTTLSVTAGVFQLNSGGTVSGGTLSAVGGSFQWNGGELDGVTFRGAMSLSGMVSAATISSAGIVLQGATGRGAGKINISGYGAALWFQGGPDP